MGFVNLELWEHGLWKATDVGKHDCGNTDFGNLELWEYGLWKHDCGNMDFGKLEMWEHGLWKARDVGAWTLEN